MQCSICFQIQEIISPNKICSECLIAINQSNESFNIYVLQCRDRYSGQYKYYIGKTTIDVRIRFQQHQNAVLNNCAWTAKYKPVTILETIKSNDPLDENKITKKYMMKYGIDNVRGGSYTKIELEDWMIKSLEHEFASAKDMCYKCNEKGHFIKNCPHTILKLYLDDFKHIHQINEEIGKLEQVYGQILILNHQIKQTDNFDVKKYKKYSDENDKYNELCIKYDTLICHVNRTQTATEELRNIDQIKETFLDSKNVYDDYTIRMNNVYNELFINDKYFNNGIFKMYKLIIFNLEKKTELKELLRFHISEDLIKMKLEGLYEKKINLLSN